MSSLARIKARLHRSVHFLPRPSTLLLVLSALCSSELTGTGMGSASAAVAVGFGGVGIGSPTVQTGAAVGSIQPVRRMEMTTRRCDLNALSRIQDDRYCDKYYVCSNGFYVGLFCPIGMAFDFGLQECRLKHEVDCTTRPLISGGMPTEGGTVFGASQLPTTTTTTTTVPPTPTTPATHMPISVMPLPSPVKQVPDPSTGVPTTSPPTVPPSHGHFGTGGSAGGNVVVLPFGAKVVIPFGSTIFLPPGSQIQMQDQLPTGLKGQQHQHDDQTQQQDEQVQLTQQDQQQQVHKQHRRSSTLADGIPAASGNHNDPMLVRPTTAIPFQTPDNKAETIDVVNDEHQQTTDVPNIDDETNTTASWMDMADEVDLGDDDYYYMDDEGTADIGEDYPAEVN